MLTFHNIQFNEMQCNTKAISAQTRQYIIIIVVCNLFVQIAFVTVLKMGFRFSIFLLLNITNNTHTHTWQYQISQESLFHAF